MTHDASAAQPPAPSRAPVRADELGAVALGGAAGALARAALAEALPRADPASWPWATFATNLLGCLLLGLLLGRLASLPAAWHAAHPDRSRLARPLLAGGVLGGFTTFSTFSVETRGMLAAGATASALGYVLLSVVAGVALVAAGRRLVAPTGLRQVDVTRDEDL